MLHSVGASLERPLMRVDDILSQSGRSSVISVFCGINWEETLRAVQHPDGAAGYSSLWPAARGTDSRWCGWSSPQCSGLHGQTVQSSSPDGWPSCWSCWWTPRRERHTRNRRSGGWHSLTFYFQDNKKKHKKHQDCKFCFPTLQGPKLFVSQIYVVKSAAGSTRQRSAELLHYIICPPEGTLKCVSVERAAWLKYVVKYFSNVLNYYISTFFLYLCVCIYIYVT